MAAIRRNLSGVKFTPRPDPPRWSVSPWHSMVVVDPCAGPKTYKVSDVARILCDSYGLYNEVGTPTKKYHLDVALRFRQVRVFCRDDYQPVLLRAYSIVGEDDAVVVEDMPSKMLRARVGYRFPEAFQQVVYHKTPPVPKAGVRDSWDDVIIALETGGLSTSYLVYFDILWRPDKVQLVTKAQAMFSGVVQTERSDSWSEMSPTY